MTTQPTPPTPPKVRLAFVDETGNLKSDLTPETLAALLLPFLPKPVVAAPVIVPAPAPLAPNAPRAMTHHKVDDAKANGGVYVVKADEVPTHFLYSGASSSTVQIVSAATEGYLETFVYIWGPAQALIPQIDEWYTRPPLAGERGWLIVTLHFYTRKPVWGASWGPAVTVRPTA